MDECEGDHVVECLRITKNGKVKFEISLQLAHTDTPPSANPLMLTIKLIFC